MYTEPFWFLIVHVALLTPGSSFFPFVAGSFVCTSFRVCRNRSALVVVEVVVGVGGGVEEEEEGVVLGAAEAKRGVEAWSRRLEGSWQREGLPSKHRLLNLPHNW